MSLPGPVEEYELEELAALLKQFRDTRRNQPDPTEGGG